VTRKSNVLWIWVLSTVLCLILFFVGPMLLRFSRSQLHLSHSSEMSQAWFESPTTVSERGITGKFVAVAYETNYSHVVRWTASAGTHQVSRGSFLAVPRQTRVVLVPTAGARPRQWLIVYVAGIATPLKARVA
jgi:hypothetical protein